MKIGELAKRSRLTAHSIRCFERFGPLPYADRDQSSLRDYDASILSGIAFLIRFKTTGMPIREILRTQLHALAIAGTLASAAIAPTTVYASPAMPEILWAGFNAPTGIATAPDGAVYVSNWGNGTVERIGVDGSRTTVLDGIASPAGIAIDMAGAVFVASYSADYIVRLAPDGTYARVADDLATPTGLAFTADGRLLVANRAAGEILSIDLSNGSRRVLARALSLPVGVVVRRQGKPIRRRHQEPSHPA